MPTVPTRQPDQVQLRALPSARVTTQAPAEAFGGGQVAAQTERALSGVVQTSVNIFAAEKKKADELAVQDAYMATLQEKNRLAYDPKEGFTRRKGKDAMTSVGEFQGQFTSFLSSQADTLSNDAQRRAYSKIAGRISIDFDQSLQRHAGSEGQKYDLEQTNSALVIARNDAVDNYQNPNAVKDSINSQRSLLTDHATRNGKSVEWLKENIANAVSGTHVGVMERMLANNQDPDAKAYFKGIKKELTGSDSKKIEKILKAGSVRGESQRLVTKMFADGLTKEEGLEQIQRIKDPEVLDATRTRWDQDVSAVEKQRLKARNNQFNELALTVEETGNRDLIPDAVWDSLLAEDKRKLNKLIKEQKSGKDISTDWRVYSRLESMPREQFKDVNLPDFFASLNKTERKELTRKQNDPDPLFSPQKQLKAAINNLDDFKDKDGDFNQRGLRLVEALKRRLDRIPKKEHTEEKVNDILFKDLLMPLQKRGFLSPLTKTVYRFEAPELGDREEQAKSFLENIPGKLAGFTNVRWNTTDNVYFIQNEDGTREVFDRFGNFIFNTVPDNVSKK